MRALGVTWLAGIALTGVAFGQVAAIPDRMRASTVCDYIAGVTADASLDGDRVGLFVTDGLVWQGVLDLDGDGTGEIVVPSQSMGSMGGDGYDIVAADGTQTYVGREGATDADMPDGFGGAFMNFAGRWFYIVFAWDSGAFPVGALAFEKGLKPATACRFDHTIEERMGLANLAPQSFAEWCWGTALADAKAGRLKPFANLDDAQEDVLVQALIQQTQSAGSSLQGFSGKELYRPAAAPFAGLVLWKVGNSSGAGRGCGGRFFVIVESDGAGGYRIGNDKRQRLLNRMQADSNDFDVYNCSADVDLFEADGRLFIERHAGEKKAVIDTQLLHAIVASDGDAARQVCASSFRVTPSVTYIAPGLAR